MDWSKRLPTSQNMASAIDWRVKTLVQELGWELPCIVKAVDNTHGIVTIEFQVQNAPFVLPEITIPVVGFQYIRFPIQVGEPGVTKKADVDLANIAGYTTSPPDMSNSGNLTAVLQFMPTMNVKFTPVENPNVLYMYGPEGVVIYDINKNSVVTVGQSEISIKHGSAEVKVSNNRVDINGTLYINGQQYLTHHHSGVSTGSSNTGGVV